MSGSRCETWGISAMTNQKKMANINPSVHRRLAPVATALVLAITVLLLPVHAQVPKTDAEKYVFHQLKLTGFADLTKSGLKEPTLRHEFLEDLVTSSVPLGAANTRGILIIGAIVNDEVVVSNATILYPLAFQQCHFKGGFDLSSNTFNHSFQLINGYIGLPATVKDTEATLRGAHFAGDVNFDGTTFDTDVDFSDMQIGGALGSRFAHYDSADGADFNDLQVQHETTFLGTDYKGGLDLSGAELAELTIEGNTATSQESASAPAINLLLNRAHISKGMNIQNLALSGFGAISAVVKSDARLANATLSGPVFLSGGNFQYLKIQGLDQWMAQAKKSTFDGLSFDSVSTDSKRNPDALGMLELLNKGPYNAQPYIALEKYLRTRGDADGADEVYFDMRSGAAAQLDPFSEFLDRLQYYLVGYGRQTWRAAILALALVAFGTGLFWDSSAQKMEHEDDSTDNWYNPFWYSLDLLSPVDLGISKKWRPKNSLLRTYGQIHRVAGWILIPLIAAAITGIIK